MVRKNHRIIESYNGLGWKGPQGSWSFNPPTTRRATNLHISYQTRPPRAPFNLALNTSRDGWGIHSLSGQPVPAPHHSLCEELPPDIQPKSSLLQLKTISPCPAVIYPFEELNKLLCAPGREMGLKNHSWSSDASIDITGHVPFQYNIVFQWAREKKQAQEWHPLSLHWDDLEVSAEKWASIPEELEHKLSLTIHPRTYPVVITLERMLSTH